MKLFSAYNHFFLFEIISILTTIYILSSILCFSVFYKFNSGLSEKKFGLIKVFFNTTLSNATTSNLQMIVHDIEHVGNTSYIDDGISGTYSEKGVIIVNKKKFKNIFNNNSSSNSFFLEDTSIDSFSKKKNKSELITMLNDNNFQNAFIFKDHLGVSLGRSLLSDYTKYITDIFNFLYLNIIFLFVLFMKITLSRRNFFLFKKSKNSNEINSMHEQTHSILNKRFFYSSVIFHLSVILIVPLLYRNFNDLEMDIFLGFKKNYFNSFLFDRIFLYSEQQSNLNLYVESNSLTNEKFQHKNNFFFLERSNILKYNHYNYVMLILCLSLIVWISRLFYETIFHKGGDINSKLNSNSEIDVQIPKSLREVFSFLVYILCFTAWAFLLFIGVLNFLDNIYLYNLMILRNFSKMLDVTIGSYVILTYLQIYLYSYMIVYSFRLLYAKNKKKNEFNKISRDNEDAKEYYSPMITSSSKDFSN